MVDKKYKNKDHDEDDEYEEDESYEEDDQDYEDDSLSEKDGTHDEMNKKASIRKMITIGAFLLAGIGLYYIFYSGDSGKKDEKPTAQEVNRLLKDSGSITKDSTAHIVTEKEELPEIAPLDAPGELPEPKNPENLPPFIAEYDEKPKVVVPEVKEPVVQVLKPPVVVPEVTPSLPKLVQSEYGEQDTKSIIKSKKFGRSRGGASSATPMLLISGGVHTESNNSINQSSNDAKSTNSSGDKKTADEAEAKKKLFGSIAGASPNSDLIEFKNTSAERATASRMPNPNMSITQGKIIDATLETAINSDLDGTVTAIVSDNVYANAGSHVLIPRGSKLIGKYSYTEDSSFTRVSVVWSRVINIERGFDIFIDSFGIDALGRNGVSGVLDSKFRNALTSAMLVAGTSIATSAIISQIPEINGQTLTVTPSPTQSALGSALGNLTGGSTNALNNASTQTVATVSGKIVEKAVNDLNDTLTERIKKYVDAKPTIYIDQGTKIKIFVSKDIVLPKEVLGGTDSLVH